MVPTYFRRWNMSGVMRSISRFESENHMFGRLMSSISTLVELNWVGFKQVKETEINALLFNRMSLNVMLFLLCLTRLYC